MCVCGVCGVGGAGDGGGGWWGRVYGWCYLCCRAFCNKRRALCIIVSCAGNLVELSLVELEADTTACMRRMYSRFHLMSGWDAASPCFDAYTARMAGFRKNQHSQLSGAAAAVIAREWAPAFREWGYDLRLATEQQ